jgi:Fe-Mn family superoxide dismutase
MAFELPPLPYGKSALEPHMSAKTLDFHHDKHHRAYVSTLNDLVKGSPLVSKPLSTVVRETAGNESQRALFNNAAQAWNHEFFWHSMRPGGGGSPTGDLAQAIERDLGGLDKFKQQFKATAVGQFGSGWAWLVLDRSELKILKTANAQTPIASDAVPLVACDVWEHAYYLDYQNRRPDFVQAFLDHLINWDEASKRMPTKRQSR